MKISKEWTAILENVEKFGKPGSVFYRGHRVALWPLHSSLYRNKRARANESQMYHDFQIRAGKLIERGRTSWEILAEMQHHGIPTRLLDLSGSFGVALFFALWKTKGKRASDACIWMVDPYKLNKRSYQDDVIPTVGVHPSIPDYYESFLQEKAEWKHDLPVAMLAPWAHPRILAQRGVFLIQGNSNEAMDKLVGDCMQKVVIPKGVHEEARNYLLRAGIDPYSLFADLDGLADWIQENYC